MNAFLEGAAWIAVLVIAALIFIGTSDDYHLAMQAVGWKLMNATIAVVSVRLTLKGFDKASGLPFRDIIAQTRGASYALPVLQYCGYRFIAVCILFGLIFSA